MTTLTNNSHTTALATTAISLRIIQPGVDDRIVQLSSGKSTVGSSDRCQVQLASAQVRPLHCLIVHESTGTSVTRWAPGALLNNQEFAKAPFQIGDCIQIGDVQISLFEEEKDSHELQEPLTGPVPFPTESKSPLLPAPDTAQFTFAPLTAPSVQLDTDETSSNLLPASHDVCSPKADRLVSQLKTANNGVRKRCRKLIGTLRTMRTEATSFEQRTIQLQEQLKVALDEREQIFRQLSQLQGEASQHESQSSEETDRLISELTTAYEKASATEATLAEQALKVEQTQGELASLQGQREQWDQIRSAGELQRAKLAQALADREQAIDTLQDEIETLRESTHQEEATRVDQATALERLQTELEQVLTERDELTTTQVESRQRQQEAEQSQADSEQNLAVFQLELEKFQITSRNTEQELFESNADLEKMQAEFAPLRDERDQLVTKRTEYQLREQGWEHELTTRDDQIELLSTEIEQLRLAIAEVNQGAADQVTQVDKAQHQLDSLTSERDQLILAQADFVQNNQEWEESVATRDRRIRELEEEHIGICEMLQSVEEGAFEQVDSCNKLEEQLSNLRTERDQQSDALRDRQASIQQFEQSLAERDGQIIVLSDELTKATEHQTNIETELAQSTNAYQALESKFAEMSLQSEQLVEAQGSHEEHKAATEQALAESLEQIEQLQQQIKIAQQERQELDQVIVNDTQSSEQVQGKMADLQSRYEQLTKDHQAKIERSRELDQKLAERDQDIELFHVDLKSNQAELDRAVEQVSNLQTERETQAQQIEGLREELATKEFANQELESKNTKDEEDNSAQGLIAELEEDKGQLQQRLEQQDQQTKQLTFELEQARQCLQTAEQALLNRAEEAVAEPAEISDEPVISPSAEPVDSATEGESYQEDSRGANDFHDAYPTEEAFETDNTYRDEVDSFGGSEFTEHNYVDQNTEMVDETDALGDDTSYDDTSHDDDDTSSHDDVADDDVADGDITNDSISEDGVADDGSSFPIAEAIQSTSTAFDKSEPEQEEATDEDFKPTSFIDQYQHLLDDNEPICQEPAPSEPEPAPVANKLGSEIDATEDGCDEDSDEALQAYMSNMLSRMRGDSNDEVSQPSQPKSEAIKQNPNPVTAVDDIRGQITPDREVTEQPENDEPFSLEQLKSSPKQGQSIDLSAMRELANSSARQAIAKHHKRLHLEKALGLFFVCLIAIGVGGYMLLAAISLQDYFGFQCLGGAAAVLVGAVGVYKLLGQLLLAIREGAWQKKQQTAAKKQKDCEVTSA